MLQENTGGCESARLNSALGLKEPFYDAVARRCHHRAEEGAELHEYSRWLARSLGVGCAVSHRARDNMMRLYGPFRRQMRREERGEGT